MRRKVCNISNISSPFLGWRPSPWDSRKSSSWPSVRLQTWHMQRMSCSCCLPTLHWTWGGDTMQHNSQRIFTSQNIWMIKILIFFWRMTVCYKTLSRKFVAYDLTLHLLFPMKYFTFQICLESQTGHEQLSLL